jgi:two-component system catabolic regulation response regulator CreB
MQAGPRHVLLVDDEPHVALLVRPLLEQLGVTVVAARSLAEARLALARPPEPAALLLDLHLPDGSGLELLEELRAAPATAGLPVLVITAEGDDRVLDAVARIGAHVLTKPFSPTKLSQRVLALLATRGPERA